VREDGKDRAGPRRGWFLGHQRRLAARLVTNRTTVRRGEPVAPAGQ
jgi:hypothetical protein